MTIKVTTLIALPGMLLSLPAAVPLTAILAAEAHALVGAHLDSQVLVLGVYFVVVYLLQDLLGEGAEYLSYPDVTSSV